MTREDRHIGQESFTNTFARVFERMIVKMQEVDDWCVQMTQDITKNELSLIGYIGDNDGVIMRQIATFLDAPFSTATGIVDKLVQKKYLKRYHSEEDRRTVMVGLSKKGSELHCMFRDKKLEVSKKIGVLLSDDEQDQLISILEKIEKNF